MQYRSASGEIRLTSLRFSGGRHVSMVVVTGLTIGFYDGAIGPGTGSFLVFALVGLLGFLAAVDVWGDFLNGRWAHTQALPVGTLAIGEPGAANAALLAASIVSNSRPELRQRLRAWRAARTDEVMRDTNVGGSAR